MQTNNAIPMILTCPACGTRHIDIGAFATKPHHTHACQACGMVWRPAIIPTVGVQFLPGFKNHACLPYHLDGACYQHGKITCTDTANTCTREQ